MAQRQREPSTTKSRAAVGLFRGLFGESSESDEDGDDSR